MDLKDFVSDSIFQICAGINDAQEKTKDFGAVVSPRCLYQQDGVAHLALDDQHVSTASIIHFDVALSVSESGGNENKGEKSVKLQIAEFAKLEAGISSGNKKDAHQETSSISRLQFDIPVMWPMRSGEQHAKALRQIQYPTMANQQTSAF